jgi:transposase InsO family protein
VQFERFSRGIRGFATVADRGLYWDMICKSAEERLKVLRFWERHGLQAAKEAFGVSRRTLFAWRSQLQAGGGQPHALAPRSTRPQHVRRRAWPKEVIEHIRQLRTAHPNLGKEKLHRFVHAFCQQLGHATPSSRTIGRLIADAPDKMRYAPPRHHSRFYPQGMRRRPRARKPKGYRAQNPGDCLAWDSVERRLTGQRRYLITSTDLASRFGFALGVKSLSSASAELAWRIQQHVFPVRTHRALSDNGYEFGKHFHQALVAAQVTHWHTYPRTPKMNAHCERFNRTLQEEFVNYEESLLFDDLDAFNARLFLWLGWYNLQRPHHALALRTPIQVISDFVHQPCRMYWPNTQALPDAGSRLTFAAVNYPTRKRTTTKPRSRALESCAR